MKKSIGCLMIIVSLFVLFIAGGCQPENESDIIKKARLVGQENIELKKQLKQKDQAIQEQKDLLAQCRQEMSTAQEDSSQANTKLLQMIAEASKESDALRAENEQLKEKLKATESK